MPCQGGFRRGKIDRLNRPHQLTGSSGVACRQRAMISTKSLAEILSARSRLSKSRELSSAAAAGGNNPAGPAALPGTGSEIANKLLRAAANVSTPGVWKNEATPGRAGGSNWSVSFPDAEPRARVRASATVTGGCGASGCCCSDPAAARRWLPTVLSVASPTAILAILAARPIGSPNRPPPNILGPAAKGTGYTSPDTQRGATWLRR